MAFEKKEWKNRQSEYPNRRVLTPSGSENEFDVARSEGLVMEDGDPFEQGTMNDLEGRIDSAVSAVQTATTEAQSSANNAQTTANAAMPKAGGYFTGNVVAQGGNTAGNCMRNIYVNGANTSYLIMVRK